MPLDFDQLNGPAIAGAGGSLVSLRFAPGLSWWERMFNFACGTIAAVELAPALAEFLKLSSSSMLSGLSFAIGLFGLSVANALIVALREIKLSDALASWFNRNG